MNKDEADFIQLCGDRFALAEANLALNIDPESTREAKERAARREYHNQEFEEEGRVLGYGGNWDNANESYVDKDFIPKYVAGILKIQRAFKSGRIPDEK